TLSPAEIFGVADRMGSIEVGKIANLIVMDGGLFEDGTRMETVFVDGERFDVGRPVVAAAAGPAPERPAPERAEPVGAGAGAAAPPVPMADTEGPYRSDPVTLIRGATI